MWVAQRTAMFVAFCCLSLLLASQTSHGLGMSDATSDQMSDGQHRRSSGGIFSMILSPLRATITHARRLFGHGLDDAKDIVVDGYNQIQMRTFRMFMSLYNKTYSPEEIPRRMALFFERRKLIEQSIRDFSEGKLPFIMRENAFIDWDETELKALTGVSPPKSFSEMTSEERHAVTEMRHENSQTEFVHSDDEDPKVSRSFSQDGDDGSNDLAVKATVRIPATKDWRTSGCVATPINQFKCGACYAIATMGALESVRCIKQLSSSILAPQQVVDCANVRAGYKNYGCDGGWPTRVLQYLQDVGVAARESCYPFVRRQNSCKLSSVKKVSGCTVSASPTDTALRYKVLNNERDILYHVAKTGPVITVMRATDKFLYFGGGIFDDPECTRRRDDVDHAIVIVGYGREGGRDYWLIKNSWGTTDWGEGGYAKYKRGTNACSIGHWGWVITS